MIDVTGLLFAIFYILTALATIVYYRRRVFSGAWDFVILGVLPLGAAGFLGWMFVKSVQAAAAAQIWSLVGIVGAGPDHDVQRALHPALAVLPDPPGERLLTALIRGRPVREARCGRPGAGGPVREAPVSG